MKGNQERDTLIDEIMGYVFVGVVVLIVASLVILVIVNIMEL